MNPIQGHSPIWHDNSGIDALAAQVAANDKRRRDARVSVARKAFAHTPPAGKAVLLAIDQIEAAMLPGFDPIKAQESEDLMSMTNDPHLLGDDIPVLQVIRCPNANDAQCRHPACGCHCMPIKAEAFTLRQLPAMTQEEHAEQLESTRDPRTPASFKHLAVMCLVTAIFTVLAIVSSPLLLQRATAIVSAWIN